MGCATLLCACNSRERETAPPAEAGTNAAAIAPSAAKPEFERLAGKWARADGDYLLELRSVDAQGNLEAAYYNPEPIHVSRAVAFKDSEGIQAVVELKDVNYPGCLYRLKYDAKNDQLHGTYYQAAMDTTYNVAFARAQ